VANIGGGNCGNFSGGRTFRHQRHADELQRRQLAVAARQAQRRLLLPGDRRRLPWAFFVTF
jgi:hypothetical protein